jgi:hypothetical protein
MKIFLLLLIQVPAFSLCRIEDGITRARPGAVWVMNDSAYEKLTWLDITQSKPTLQEVLAGVDGCRNEESSRFRLKDAARFAVKSSTTTTTQKINALILLLDMDK